MIMRIPALERIAKNVKYFRDVAIEEEKKRKMANIRIERKKTLSRKEAIIINAMS